MTPVLKSVELPSGVRLEYAEQGDPAGVPVLMLHGVTDSWRSFEPRAAASARVDPRLRAVAAGPRRLRTAREPAIARAISPPTLAAFTDALGLGPAVVVGHSMGSTNAMRFAIDHPCARAASCSSARSRPTAATRRWSNSGSLP